MSVDDMSRSLSAREVCSTATSLELATRLSNTMVRPTPIVPATCGIPCRASMAAMATSTRAHKDSLKFWQTTHRSWVALASAAVAAGAYALFAGKNETGRG